MHLSQHEYVGKSAHIFQHTTQETNRNLKLQIKFVQLEI